MRDRFKKLIEKVNILKKNNDDCNDIGNAFPGVFCVSKCMYVMQVLALRKLRHPSEKPMLNQSRYLIPL